jgi:copper chaperone CopZ
VQKADVSFRDKQARVTFDPDRVGVEQMIEAVNRIGFRASLKAAEPTR